MDLQYRWWWKDTCDSVHSIFVCFNGVTLLFFGVLVSSRWRLEGSEIALSNSCWILLLANLAVYLDQGNCSSLASWAVMMEIFQFSWDRVVFWCWRHFSLRMIQLNLIKDLLYSSINGEKDLGLGRNYEGIQYEEQMKL